MPLLGNMVDRYFFEGDDLIYLPQDNVIKIDQTLSGRLAPLRLAPRKSAPCFTIPRDLTRVSRKFVLSGKSAEWAEFGTVPRQWFRTKRT